VFILPVNLRDMAIGVATAQIVRSLMRYIGFTASRNFIRWNAHRITVAKANV